jgi:glycosyltransferase involved in cell wall biosynthesis
MKVLLTMWADPAMYLATTFTARMLSERGVCLDLLYRSPNSHLDVAGDVKFGIRTRLRPVEGGHAGWRDKIDYAKFIVKATMLAWREKPDAVIGYNTLGIVAAFIATRIRPKTKLIYHNFDFDVSTSALGPLGRLLRRIELVAARRADMTIFPAPGRAAKYKTMARLTREPLSVLNCFPLSWPRQKTGELQRLLENKGLCFDRLVVHLGSIDPFHGIEATIRSVPEWKGNWGLILAGFSNGSYLEDMQKLVEQLGLANRVIFLPSVSYSLWYDCLYSAHLGICLYEPCNLSHAYMAGTSQKLNNYLVAGIPSIVSNSPDFIAFVERYNTSKVAEATDPHSIAHAVNSLLCDPEEYAAHCRAVKHAFESEFNFDKQFEPILRQLVDARHAS